MVCSCGADVGRKLRFKNALELLQQRLQRLLLASDLLYGKVHSLLPFLQLLVLPLQLRGFTHVRDVLRVKLHNLVGEIVEVLCLLVQSLLPFCDDICDLLPLDNLCGSLLGRDASRTEATRRSSTTSSENTRRAAHGRATAPTEYRSAAAICSEDGGCTTCGSSSTKNGRCAT